MFTERKKRAQALEQLKTVLEWPDVPDDERMFRALDAVSGLKPGSPLRTHCEMLIRAKDYERTVQLLEVARKRDPMLIGTIGLVGIALLAVVGLQVLLEFTSQPATIVNQTHACAEDLLSSLEMLQTDAGLGFDATPEHAQELLQSSALSVAYARDGVRYTMQFRVRTSGEGCQLQAYRLTSRSPGSTDTRRGDFGTVPLDVCVCE